MALLAREQLPISPLSFRVLPLVGPLDGLAMVPAVRGRKWSFSIDFFTWPHTRPGRENAREGKSMFAKLFVSVGWLAKCFKAYYEFPFTSSFEALESICTARIIIDPFPDPNSAMSSWYQKPNRREQPSHMVCFPPGPGKIANARIPNIYIYIYMYIYIYIYI